MSRSGPLPKKYLDDAVYEVLISAREPMLTKDIYAALLRHGIEFPGTKPLHNMVARMSKDMRFQSVKGVRSLWQIHPLAEKALNRVENA